MGSKINIRARIERHSRILQQNLYIKTRNPGKKGVKFLSLLVIATFPIYPSFASFIHSTSITDFDRGNIDESSIISSYFGDDGVVGDGEVFIQSKDSYLQVNAIMTEDNSNVSATKEVIEYEIGDGESIASIANKFNITKDSIHWANNFHSDHTIHPGDTIKVPPVSGLIHKVVSGETLGGLSEKYKVVQRDIMRQNLLLAAEDLKIGDTIIIPGAIKEKPKPKPVPKPVYSAAPKASGYSFSAKAQSQYVTTKGKFEMVWRQPYSGVWGNCTWYVASYKGVDWRGNANQWMRNAQKNGHPTGSEPVVGAIVQFEGRGYNPYYGHVGIVIDVTATDIIVSDMNYRRLGEVTTRKVPRSDRTIKGFIYVD